MVERTQFNHFWGLALKGLKPLFKAYSQIFQERIDIS